MRTRNSPRESAAGGKTLKAGTGSIAAFAAKLRKKWQFAPDAIGMFSGARALSQRNGLSSRFR